MGTLSEPGDVALRVADVLARVVTLREALEDGAGDYAWNLLVDLEADLAGRLHQRRPVIEAADIPWPGEAPGVYVPPIVEVPARRRCRAGQA